VGWRVGGRVGIAPRRDLLLLTSRTCGACAKGCEREEQKQRRNSMGAARAE